MDLSAQLHAVGLKAGLEPMTALTDAILAAWTLLLAIALFRHANGRKPVVLWAWAFVALTVSSLDGVAYHGYRMRFGFTVIVLLWKIVPVATGIATLCLGAAAAIAWLAPRARRVAITLLVLEFVACLIAAALSNDFLVVVIDYAPVMIAILIGSIAHWSERAARFIAAGVVVSFIAAGVQISSLQIGRFDHNDIFHVIQMIAMYLLYRGGAQLRG
ncbi:MAG TPA: hypothetical protein VMU84_06545 [Thermoanaerobaculia bacterium]|nr:hypothetical protein [Thermoanaerobaculia bacterium]